MSLRAQRAVNRGCAKAVRTEPGEAGQGARPRPGLIYASPPPKWLGSRTPALRVAVTPLPLRHSRGTIMTVEATTTPLAGTAPRRLRVQAARSTVCIDRRMEPRKLQAGYGWLILLLLTGLTTYGLTWLWLRSWFPMWIRTAPSTAAAFNLSSTCSWGHRPGTSPGTSQPPWAAGVG